jgi:nucleotide-binding universal stress UspA family protein
MYLLMATGGSAHSKLVLDLGLQLLRRSKSTQPATILTVIGTQTDGGHADRILGQAREKLAETSVPIQIKTRYGKAGPAIVAEAVEGAYDLIVVGERPKHRLVTRLIGSTTAYVVAHAPCPVIIAKGKIKPINRLLLCDSGAESPALLKRFTTRLKRLALSEIDVTVLHVMSQITAGPGVPGRQLRAGAEELIAEHTPEGELLIQDVQLLSRADLHPRAKVRHGLVVEEIVEEAHSGDYDLVVIGTNQEGSWRRFLLDNLTQQIIKTVDRPVLVIR